MVPVGTAKRSYALFMARASNVTKHAFEQNAPSCATFTKDRNDIKTSKMTPPPIVKQLACSNTFAEETCSFVETNAQYKNHKS